jgi:hypothetical protein
MSGGLLDATSGASKIQGFGDRCIMQSSHRIICDRMVAVLPALTFPFFRADQLSAILLSGLTIRVIVVRLGDDGSRGQHDPNNRANDCVPHVVIAPACSAPVVAEHYQSLLTVR